VIVVGAGPAGSTAAAYLAASGVETIVVDKSNFPREKACGDGLTPRAVKELITLGVPSTELRRWPRNDGLRVLGGGHVLELPWPSLDSYPDYGLAKPRAQFDQFLAQRAQAQGAQLREGWTVTGPVLNDRTGRVEGVTARSPEGETTLRAPLVIAADGVSARLGSAVGRARKPNRPVGVAVRAYARVSDQVIDKRGDLMESHLELRDAAGGLMPGYGWLFPVGKNLVNLGVGAVSSKGKATKVNYRDLLMRWVDSLGPTWGIGRDDLLGRPASAALPMAFNRGPLYARGLLLVGDAGGMVSPFNGEGIAYAMQSGRLAAQACAQALARNSADSRERALRTYPANMKRSLGGYFTLGRAFVSLIEHPRVMHLCTKYGLTRPTLMRFTMKLLADLYEVRGGDWMDRVIAGLTRIVPVA
jgi:geranylgeranyl reductase family protein